MSALPKCDGCGRRFREGESAVEHDIKELRINGGMVTQVERVGIYCEYCQKAAA